MLLQADAIFERSKPDTAVWTLRPDHEELRHGDVSRFLLMIVRSLVFMLRVFQCASGGPNCQPIEPAVLTSGGQLSLVPGKIL